MGDFIKGTLSIILAGIIINLVYDWYYEISTYPPKLTISTPTSTPLNTPTNTTTNITVTVRIKLLWENLEDAKIYESDIYSESYKRTLRKTAKSCFIERNTLVEVLEHKYPYVRLRALDGRDKGCEGWTT